MSTQTNPVWLFMAATAMATTVSTLTATAMVKADSAEPVAVTCTCESEPAAAPAPTIAPPQAVAEAPEPPTARSELGNEDANEDLGIASKPEPQDEVVAQVEGGLDKDIIRRIVRAHINEVRYCYNEGLKGNPGLAGRVVVAFTIGADGLVSKSEASSPTMDGSDVPPCIAQAIQRWKFPKPADAQSVQVTYPFVLEPG